MTEARRYYFLGLGGMTRRFRRPTAGSIGAGLSDSLILSKCAGPKTWSKTLWSIFTVGAFLSRKFPA